MMKRVFTHLPLSLLLLLFLGLVLRLIFSVQIYSGDVNNHIAWAKDSLSSGFSGIYGREFFFRYGTLPPTYPPIPLFFFTGFYWLYNWVYGVSWSLNNAVGLFPSNFIFFLEDQDTMPAFLKIPAILADLGIVVVVYLFARKILVPKSLQWSLVTASFVLFNPAFFYNSAWWGQIEAVSLFFVLLSFYLLLYSKRRVWPAVFFTLAILTKQTSIVFVPVFALVYLLRFGIGGSVKAFLVSVGVFWISFIPFFKTGNIFFFPFSMYWSRIQMGSGSDFVTDHAFNFWALISGLGKIPDSTLFWLDVSYRLWGFLIFGFLAGLILWQLYRKKAEAESVLVSNFLIASAAFFFLTRMHERYLEQALPFLLLAGLKDKRALWLFGLLSMFHFANLYHNWWAPRVNVVVDLLSDLAVIHTLIVFAIGVFLCMLAKHLKGVRL